MYKTVDLRSDTVTQPTLAMREAMLAAPLGDDVFGDDPSVNALQAHIADITGKEAALFMPTGTQSNLCALMTHCERGDEYIVGQLAHTYRFEGGGAAVLGSIQPQPLTQGATGEMQLTDIAAAIKPDDPHFARSRLLCLENTWNGHPMTLAYLAQATGLARERGLATHLDGARLFNAAVATPDAGADAYAAARHIASYFDSVSVCFSKGLGAPVGSALCGSRALIARALRWRKMLGGGMRQAGILAAAGLYALEHNIQRLAEDHENAARLARGLAQIPAIEVSMPDTNIIYVNIAAEKCSLLDDTLRRNGILARVTPRMRIVLHLDVSRADVERTIAAFKQFAAA
jgi:threonine aldolase